jgi:hypothetical protein
MPGHTGITHNTMKNKGLSMARWILAAGLLGTMITRRDGGGVVLPGHREWMGGDRHDVDGRRQF